MTTSATSPARMDFRTSAEVKSLIERAATLAGMTVSEYIKATMVERSEEIVARYASRRLSDRDRDLFLTMLDSPATPNDALRSAAEGFKSMVESGSLQR